MPTAGSFIVDLIPARPGSPNAATMMPSQELRCASAISSTSGAAVSSASGVTIIEGARVAVAPTISKPSTVTDVAIATIIAVVASRLFGLIRRMRTRRPEL